MKNEMSRMKDEILAKLDDYKADLQSKKDYVAYAKELVKTERSRIAYLSITGAPSVCIEKLVKDSDDLESNVERMDSAVKKMEQCIDVMEYIKSMKEEDDVKEYDQLYNIFEQLNLERKKSNFNAFMSGLDSGIVSDLNKKYQSGDIKDYDDYVHRLKDRGIRVFRNDKGEHKVKFV